MNNTIMNVVSTIFIIVVFIYVFSTYKKRKAVKEKIYNNSKDKILYLFVDLNINLIELNKSIPLPLSKSEYLQFNKIPKRSKAYVFEYTNILELIVQYETTNMLKKNTITDKMNLIFNVRPEKIYYLYPENDTKNNVELKFEDITKEC